MDSNKFNGGYREVSRVFHEVSRLSGYGRGIQGDFGSLSLMIFQEGLLWV